MTRTARWWAILLVVLSVNAATVSSQTPRLESLMRDKMRHAQAILQAVVTSDWAGLEEHSRQLQRVAGDPAWNVLRTPAYTRQSEAFLRAASELADAAAAHDMEAAPLAYVSLTLSCIQCHRQVARSRIAGGDPLRPAAPQH